MPMLPCFIFMSIVLWVGEVYDIWEINLQLPWLGTDTWDWWRRPQWIWSYWRSFRWRIPRSLSWGEDSVEESARIAKWQGRTFWGGKLRTQPILMPPLILLTPKPLIRKLRLILLLFSKKRTQLPRNTILRETLLKSTTEMMREMTMMQTDLRSRSIEIFKWILKPQVKMKLSKLRYT